MPYSSVILNYSDLAKDADFLDALDLFIVDICQNEVKPEANLPHC